MPAGRYATASAVNSSARQLGGVLGIAILTIFIAHPTPATFADDIRKGWKLAAGAFAAAAVVALFFGRIRVIEGTIDSLLREPLLEGLRGPRPSPVVRPMSIFSICSPRTSGCGCSRQERPWRSEPAITLSHGDPGDALYVLQSGRLDVQLPDGSVRELYPESTLGELALLTDAPRSGTVVARRDSTLIRLDRDRFEQLADDHPAVMAAVAKGLAFSLQASRPISPLRPADPEGHRPRPVGQRGAD